MSKVISLIFSIFLKTPPENLELFYFFHFFEGIHGLKTEKSHMFVLCIKGSHEYVKNTCFLYDLHEVSLGFCLAIQGKGLGHGKNAYVILCYNIQ
jgi:hypothetical protein